jgi:hypothetical protein
VTPAAALAVGLRPEMELLGLRNIPKRFFSPKARLLPDRCWDEEEDEEEPLVLADDEEEEGEMICSTSSIVLRTYLKLPSPTITTSKAFRNIC